MMRSPKSPIMAIMLFLALSGCGLFIRSEPGSVIAYTEVVEAATAGNVPKVQAALDQDPRFIRKTEWDGATLLHDAVGHKEEAMAAFLISRGAEVDARTSSGLTPLHMAAQNGDMPIIRLLLDHHARLNAVDGKGWTPLDRAIKWRHPDAAEFLRARGGKANSAGRTRTPAL
jgi:ankyrin repeat protein